MDHAAVVHDDDDDKPNDDVTPMNNNDDSVRNRDVPSRAVLPMIRLSLGRQHSMSDRAKTAMQGYVSHVLGNLDIANSREVWAVLKPGFLALLKDPFDKEPLDIIVFDVLPSSHGTRVGKRH